MHWRGTVGVNPGGKVEEGHLGPSTWITTRNHTQPRLEYLGGPNTSSSGTPKGTPEVPEVVKDKDETGDDTATPLNSLSGMTQTDDPEDVAPKTHTSPK